MKTVALPQAAERFTRKREAVFIESVFVQLLLAEADVPKRFSFRQSRAALRVLVVDDEPVNQILAMAQLLAIDIVPFTANDGLEAVEMSRAQDFDIILMDIDMPVMDGISAAASIRDHQIRNPSHGRSELVAFTASALPEESLLRHVGMGHLLRKPCNAEDMGRCILNCCSKLAAAGTLHASA